MKEAKNTSKKALALKKKVSRAKDNVRELGYSTDSC